MTRFSVKYLPTALFSLKASNSTNSGAKSLFLPSPYSIKMAILNQAITCDNDFEDERISAKRKNGDNSYFLYIRDAKITYHIPKGCHFCVNNSFVKILKPAREGGGFGQTVTFREYVYISRPIEIIFESSNPKAFEYLKKHLHNINYFGKKGCFFQFMEYSDTPNLANVKLFDVTNISTGILQEFEDFDIKAEFDNVNNYSSTKAKRKKEIYVLPIKKIGTSKSYSNYISI